MVRFPRAAIGAAGILLILAGGTAIGVLNLRNLQRIDALHGRIGDIDRLQSLRRRLEISLLDEIRLGPVGTNTFLAEDVLLQIQSVLEMEPNMNPETAAGLRQIEDLLSRPGLVNRETLISALEVAGSIAELESQSQTNLLRQVQANGRRELVVGFGGLLALAFLVGMAAWLLPKRFLDPLSTLRAQLSGVGAGRYEAVSLKGMDPVLLPLFRNYNTMVERLASLEEERRARAETLESAVRAGARALLEQHRILADAERLAAVGETAAGLAHELRNPLAGILAALENLSREVEDETTGKRVGLLKQEAQRVVRLLNEYLEASRHAPEPSVLTDIGEMVGDLLGLLRYQTPPEVHLKHQVEEGLECRVPAGRIRQALLNLVANSVQALGSSPGNVTVLGSRDGGRLRLEVRDDGPGFPESFLPVAGQPFRTGREAGTGLGLAMVQRTVMDLGGSVTFSNVEPRGASVVFTVACQGGLGIPHEEPGPHAGGSEGNVATEAGNDE